MYLNMRCHFLEIVLKKKSERKTDETKKTKNKTKKSIDLS